ncbi:hypothetical protein AMECASPLE_037029 [Ameca splendens]|uniref:Uncharacterized protein n=1 Tax=Ameca splendens TaxID=208324 RepID=A0ABV0Y8B6_9TELE
MFLISFCKSCMSISGSLSLIPVGKIHREQRNVGMTNVPHLSHPPPLLDVKVLPPLPVPVVSCLRPCLDASSATLSIRLGHCYRHLCSSRWPPAGDAGLFCCSICGRPADRARGSTGTLRSLPAPESTPAGRVARTSPRTTRT